MLASAAAIYGVGASSAFDYTWLRLDGLSFTDGGAVEAALAVVEDVSEQLQVRPHPSRIAPDHDVGDARS